MLVYVYGTLKSGYWNNRLLHSAKFVRDADVPGYKLYDVGFPVALPSKEEVITGEIWDIGDPAADQTAKHTLQSLDWLENEGSMYHRTVVRTTDGAEVNMYVGGEAFWQPRTLKEPCSKVNNKYVWQRERA